jgi:tetratricopeptide (TPR) repeat protein
MASLLALAMWSPGVVAESASSTPAEVSALERGRQALHAGAPLEAITRFREAAARNPRSAAALTYLGLTAEVLGEVDEALSALRAAAQVDPSPAATMRLGLLAELTGDVPLATLSFKRILNTAAGEKAAEHLLRLSVESGQRAAALDLARGRKWLRPGADFCRAERSPLAPETLALLALLVHPSRADCVVRTAVALTGAGMVRLPRLLLEEAQKHTTGESARRTIAEYLEARLPKHDVAALAEFFNLTAERVAERFKLADVAMDAYRKAIAADLRFSRPLTGLGLLYVDRGDVDTGLGWLRKAVVVDPDDLRAQRALGGTAARATRYSEALAAYRRAAALDPRDANLAAALGRLLVRLGQRDDAAQALTRAITLDPALGPARALWISLDARTRMVDETLAGMGARDRAARATDTVRALLERHLNPEADAAVSAMVAQSVQAERVYAVLSGSLVSDIDLDRLSRVQTWLRTSSAGTLAATEASTDLGEGEEIGSYVSSFPGEMSDAPAAIIARLDRVRAISDTEVDILAAATRAILRAADGHVHLASLKPEDADRERLDGAREIPQQIGRRLRFIYRQATPKDLESYVNFWEGGVGRWFTGEYREALVGAVELVAGEAAEAIIAARAAAPAEAK